MKKIVTTVLIALIAAIPCYSIAKDLKPIHVENGVFLYPDGSEVSLFGTNYYPMSWHQYKNMKKLNADFSKAIEKDVSDMKACGVEIVRVHFFDRENSDSQGNLINNEYLNVFDILVDQLNKQGIYLYLTTLTWWPSPNELPDAYAGKVSKMRMMYGEQALMASENFIHQLLTHKNPYTNKLLKDEPCLAIYEIINEPWYWPWESVSESVFDPWFLAMYTDPGIMKQDLSQWRQMWHSYYKGKGLEPTEENYLEFQCEKMTAFLKRMIAAIRRTGADQPIASALFETYANIKHTNTGILKAIGQSEVDAVTDGGYLGGFDILYEDENPMPEFAAVWPLPQAVEHKASVVYEFDICNTYNTVHMYPAMARQYRSRGTQICCQFQYDSAITAQYNTDWGVHYFNYETTPAKAVAFKIAAETFAAIPRKTQYPTPTDNEIFFGTALSFEHKQAMRVTEDQVFYAHGFGDWTPLELPLSPKKIMGRGNSPYAEYSGSGLYVLEKISDQELRLTTTPNAVVQGEITTEFFGSGKIDSKNKLVVLDESSQKFKIKLKDWETTQTHEIKCFDENNQQVKINNNALDIIPGRIYYIRKSNY